MVLAVAVQTKGFGVPVGGGDQRVIALSRSSTERKNASFEALPSELGEEAFHGIEPGAGGRREVERPPRMFGEPGQHLRMFVGGIIVEDGVDHLAGRDGPLDGCDEADELLMPMARHAAADDLAFEHAERGEQGRRAVARLLSMREGCAFPPLQRKTRLGPVERLDLAFSRRWRPLPRGGAGSCRDRPHHQTWRRGRDRWISRKVLIRCRWSLWAAHMRWIVRRERPIALAMARPVQWVTAPGGSRRVRSTTACTLACGTGGMPGGRVLSRSRSSMPSSRSAAASATPSAGACRPAWQ